MSRFAPVKQTYTIDGKSYEGFDYAGAHYQYLKYIRQINEKCLNCGEKVYYESFDNKITKVHSPEKCSSTVAAIKASDNDNQIRRVAACSGN